MNYLYIFFAVVIIAGCYILWQYIKKSQGKESIIEDDEDKVDLVDGVIYPEEDGIPPQMDDENETIDIEPMHEDIQPKTVEVKK